jgi:tyrosine-specific transport protein
MVTTTGIFIASYIINLVSSLIIAQIAMNQKNISGNDAPSSFKEFARVTLQSDVAAIIVSTISLFINTCILSFNLNRIGPILSSSLAIPINFSVLGIPSTTLLSIVFSVGLTFLICTQSLRKLSQLSSLFVLALFLVFGSLLLPGLANVQDDPWSFIEATISPMDAIKGDGTNFRRSVTYAAPIILMSTSYQNVIPTLTKLLQYDRLQIVISLIVGSMIPVILYLSWIYACLGGGIDTSSLLHVLDDGISVHSGEISSSVGISSDMLLPIFSIVTIGGSSICGAISMAEELETFVKTTPVTIKPSVSPSLLTDTNLVVSLSPCHTEKTQLLGLDQLNSPSHNAPAFQILTSILSVTIPLFIAIVFATKNDDNDGFTGALAIAGSFGSPLLYGALPAYMAYQQLKQRSIEKQHPIPNPTMEFLDNVKNPPMNNTNYNLVPVSSLPIFGALSTGYVGQELFQLLDEVMLTTSS